MLNDEHENFALVHKDNYIDNMRTKTYKNSSYYSYQECPEKSKLSNEACLAPTNYYNGKSTNVSERESSGVVCVE